MNDLFRKIFEHFGTAVAVVKEDMTILLVNRRFEELSGYRREEVEGKKKATDFVDQIYHRQLSRYQSLLRKGLIDCPFNIELKFINRDGESSTLLVTISQLPDTKVSIFSFFSFHDATRCQLTGEDPITGYRQLLDIVNFLPDPTFIIDCQFRVVAWNKGMEELTGITSKEIIEKKHDYRSCFYEDLHPLLADLIVGRDKFKIEEHKDKYLYFEKKNNKIYAESYITSAYGGKGAYLWGVASPIYDHQGRLIGAIETIRDVTPQRKLLQALQHSEERFSRIFNASPNLMIISRLSDGRYLNVNDSFLKATGYRREEVIGRTAVELKNFWTSNDDRREKLNLLKQKGSVRNLEVHYQTCSGQLRTGLYSAELIEIDGEICVLSVINDITELKKMESSLSRLERLNLVGEMAAAIGHELRNPMTSVRGFLQILKLKPELSSYKDFFSIMIDELDRANSIITEFLSLAKNRPVHKKPLRLNSIVELLYPLLQANALADGKYIGIDTEVVPELLLDEKEIRQLILNLVMNGLDAIRPGQSVTITTRDRQDEVILSVKDEGTGISPEVLEKLGTPFFTTKEHGTGLGLAVCFSIAARHNAVIKIDTGRGGTTFHVCFSKKK